MSDDLWAEASADHDAFAREAAVAAADVHLQEVMPFLLAARSDTELAHRMALARDSIAAIAAATGISEDELAATAARRSELYRKALAEGQDPLEEVVDSTRSYGGGPEQGYEHDEGPDFSHGYSEVPAGPPGGPDPRVTAPRPPGAGPVQEAAGSLRRQADSSPGASMTMPYSPMDTGTGSGSVDTALPSSASAGMTPSLPAGVTSNGDNTVPITPSAIGQVTSVRDPVRRRVIAVREAVAASNPQLPAGECERIARLVVGRYLRRADLDGSVMDDQPTDPPAPAGGGGGGSSSSGDSGGGAGKVVQHGLEWQGLKSLIPKAAEDATELL
ncbi:MAG: hypothetical protein JWM19_885 [Actinomycetia bacterium]|nr:hypothetical protein [Actinomycetes bacterium]